VTRLESKKRLHDQCAKVVLSGESLEAQQMHVIGCIKEDKELLYQVREGIEENL
jgi:hypothetical protein